MTIVIERDEHAALARMKAGFVRAAKSGRYQGEFRSFESPAALFRVLTPARWTLMERLQEIGPSSLRGLARALGRDVKAAHRDVSALIARG
jgi:predicted transcriptional regulator